jgi:prevent-host-death family protein
MEYAHAAPKLAAISSPANRFINQPNSNHSQSNSAKRYAINLSTHIKPISYLKSHTAQIVKELSASREPMVITQNGEATLVVLDIKSFEERENTLALLKLLTLGQCEIERGQFRSADEVFASLDVADAA